MTAFLRALVPNLLFKLFAQVEEDEQEQKVCDEVDIEQVTSFLDVSRCELSQVRRDEVFVFRLRVSRSIDDQRWDCEKGKRHKQLYAKLKRPSEDEPIRPGCVKHLHLASTQGGQYPAPAPQQPDKQRRWSGKKKPYTYTHPL